MLMKFSLDHSIKAATAGCITAINVAMVMISGGTLLQTQILYNVFI